ncbi:hypothetical protein PR048_010736 [Dryococelus australis]|uniref:Integrase catalytic domain-containing protein n=1 Tax=Dryococelus australis TaxID=614101 RepID=A0ABQ9I3J0_9NEOP|nr:hypothetical protein PR048_010736 [Dryococelus australis]
MRLKGRDKTRKSVKKRGSIVCESSEEEYNNPTVPEHNSVSEESCDGEEPGASILGNLPGGKRSALSSQLKLMMLKHIENLVTFSTVVEVWMELHRLLNRGRNGVEGGKPPLPRGKSDVSQLKESVGAVEGLMNATASLASDYDDHGWYIGNGAMNHVTNQRDVLTTFETLSVTHSVKTENGEAIQAVDVIKEFLSDNEGEFDSCAVTEILRQNRTKQRLTMPYTPEQNGCSERENKTLVETAHSIMDAHEPQVLWAEIVNTASYILSQTGSSSIDGKKKRTVKIMIMCNISWEEMRKKKEFIEEQEEYNAQHEKELRN